MKRDHHAGRSWWAPLAELELWRDGRRGRKAQKAEAASEPAPAAPRGVLRIARTIALALASAIVIAASAAAFAESYRALWLWALHHGYAGFWAAIFPLEIDSFIAVGELGLFIALIDQWRARARAFPWLVTLGGLAVSVAANVGHVASADLATRATAAVPPVAAASALAVGLGILKRVVTARRAVPVPVPPPAAPAATVPGIVAPEVAGTAYEAARVAYVASVKGGNPLSERGLASRFGIPRSDARKILAEVVITANGHQVAGGNLADPGAPQ